MESVVRGDGKVFVVMMARQSGKNELAAVLYTYLLNLFANRGGDIVIGAPTESPQLGTSQTRLMRVLQTPINRGRWKKTGNCVELGNARLTFLSGEPTAHVVGATASLLLAVDEAQDVDPDVYNTCFRPMASTCNATTVLFGTARNEDNILEDQRGLNREVEQKTGQRLNFVVPWTVLAAINPLYEQYVQAEMARLGEDNPTIRTQYLLEPLVGGGRLFTPELLERMKGTHERRRTPDYEVRYVAGIDVAGSVVNDGKAILNDRDETVITIAEVDRTSRDDGRPVLKVVDFLHWRGLSHQQQQEKTNKLIFGLWHVDRAAIDSTGLGAGLASYLVSVSTKKVVPVTFTQRVKSDLGYLMLTAAETDRLKLFQSQGCEELRECVEQLKDVRYTLNSTETLAWAAGSGRHDDFVTSLALCVRAADELGPPAFGGIVRAPPDIDAYGW